MAAARGAPEVSRALVADQLVSHLLVLHELHPDSLEERVTRAIEDVRPYARSHGGDIELAAIDGDVVRVRLSGSCDGCASSTATLKLAVEDRVRAVAPGVAVVEALTGASPKDPTTFIPAEALLRKPVVAGPRPGPA
jgi:Fe-S cluster biogenesis protein NfuA